MVMVDNFDSCWYNTEEVDLYKLEVMMDTEVQEIELTSKKLKAQIAISVIMILIGLSLIIAGLAGSNTTGITGSFIGAVGVVLFIVTKARVWWRHK